MGVLIAVVADIRKQADAARREARRSGNDDALTFSVDPEALVDTNLAKVTLKAELRELFSNVVREVVAAAGIVDSDSAEDAHAAEDEEEAKEGSATALVDEEGSEAGSGAVSAIVEEPLDNSQVE